MLSRSIRLRRWLQDRLQRAHVDVARAGFYSPIVDRAEVASRAGHVWAPDRQTPASMPDIDFRPDHHEALLQGAFGRFMREFDLETETPRAANGELLFDQDNHQFGRLDARILAATLRHHAPARIIEVGSGFSTLIMDSVVAGHLRDRTRVTAIEPFPRAFLADLKHVELRQSKVQDVAPATFDQLQAGDVLFIDSSHVCKTGSDVHFLFFEILPRLKPGVLIHLHDIWLPLEYPQEWVLTEARSWNEQYLLRALLSGSDVYQVEMAASFLCRYMRPALEQALGPLLDAGAVSTAFWMRKAH